MKHYICMDKKDSQANLKTYRESAPLFSVVYKVTSKGVKFCTQIFRTCISSKSAIFLRKWLITNMFKHTRNTNNCGISFYEQIHSENIAPKLQNAGHTKLPSKSYQKLKINQISFTGSLLHFHEKRLQSFIFLRLLAQDL